MDRRDFIRRGTAVTAGAWAAPAIQSVSAATVTGSPQPCERCAGSAFDVFASFSGAVSGSVGPVRKIDTFGAQTEECFGSTSVTAPTKSDPFATIQDFCVTATESGDTCTTSAKVVGANADLRNVDPVLDLQFSATTLYSQASSTCGGGQSLDSYLVNAALTVAGVTTAVQSDAEPNTKIMTPQNPAFDFVLTLNEQSGSTVNAVHLWARDKVTGQTVDLIIASATASCTACP